MDDELIIMIIITLLFLITMTLVLIYEINVKDTFFKKGLEIIEYNRGLK